VRLRSARPHKALDKSPSWITRRKLPTPHLHLPESTPGRILQMEELYSTEGDYGLRTLSEPEKAVVEYDGPCP